MENTKYYQRLCNDNGIPIILCYVKLNGNKNGNTNGNPTTTYKLFSPYKIPKKLNHNCKTMKDLYKFLFDLKNKCMIFIAKFGAYITHIDPWMINDKEYFSDIKNNQINPIFPESTYGNCLNTTVEYELRRKLNVMK